MDKITLFGPRANGNAVPTMDAAAVSSGMAFLTSELEKFDPTLREPLTSVTYPRDIIINSGGGWIEATSNINVSYGIAGGNKSRVGGVQNDIHRIQADFDKDVWPTFPFEITMSVKWVDMQRGAVTGRAIEKIYDDGIRLAFDKYMDSNTYVGLEEHGTYGLVNLPKVSAVAVKAGASGATEWEKKTPEEILDDINTAILDAWAASQYDSRAIPNHILLPPKQYMMLVKNIVSVAGTNGAMSIMEYLKQNNIAKDKGVDIFIGECRWCSGAGVGNKDRMVAYVNDSYFTELDMPVQLSRVMTAPNVSDAAYDTLYAANVGCVKVHYYEPFVYRDGI